MSHYYGPHWQQWMPEPVQADHRRRFPARFGHGAEAAFLAFMNLRFGAGWQAWLPAPVVHQSWCWFCLRREI